jgi:hypothetical protein
MPRVRMPVEYSQYWICVDDVAEDDTNAVDIVAGLASWQPGEVIVTAADWGRSVDVYVELLDVEPTDVVDDEWQDAVEFSLTTTDGDIRLMPPMDGPKGPNLAARGPGCYRMRLSATDRDEVDSKKSRERHRLEVWPAPEGAPIAIKCTSAFAIDWATPPPPPRDVDWPALASTPGVRLIVGWKDLIAPDEPAQRQPTTVSVRGVVGGTPGQVFNEFNNPVVAGIAGGMRTARGISADNREFACFILHDLYDPQSDGDPTGWQRWVGNLELVGTALDIQRFHTLRFTLGFHEGLYVDDDKKTSHPLPPGSTTVEIHFAKHPDGREVTITHHDVPAWVGDDVAALWHLVLKQNRTYSKYAAAMPWDD